MLASKIAPSGPLFAQNRPNNARFLAKMGGFSGFLRTYGRLIKLFILFDLA
jgi:hypothetical protein